ncbi:MAG: site-specific recombinase XerD [Oleispira sp.]|jgi:site-specific recombinase XerD
MTIGISTKGNQTKRTMVSSLLKLVDSKELHPNDLKTTQIYTHVIGQHSSGTLSPIDR